MRMSFDSSTTIASLIRKLSFFGSLLSCFTVLSGPGFAQTVEIVNAPIVNEDQVTVRLKVSSSEGIPVMGLAEDAFELLVDDQPMRFDYRDWKSPQESIPPPAWIIVLLDLSGSMAQPDSRGTTKIEGALNAVQEFTQNLADRGGNTNVSIVPFGESGIDCEGHVVNDDSLDKFFAANDFKIQNHINYLSNQAPCASTNLYDPIIRAVRFLNTEEDTRFFPAESSDEIKPRRSVIVLSDGYHNKANEEKDFKSLASLLNRSEDIIVHTLGYGLTPEQLGEKYQLGRPATRQDIGSSPGKVLAEEFVDKDRLAEIAQRTGGIAEFSGNSLDIADKLELFLNSLLGEYEITYTEPDAYRGSRHIVQAFVNLEEMQLESEKSPYNIDVFGSALSTSTRLAMFFGTLIVMLLFGCLPFWLWSQSLKREIQEI